MFVAKVHGTDLREESNIVSMGCPEKLLEKFGGENEARMEDGGWKRPESSQGNGCQGNKPESAFSHSLDNHSPDFGRNHRNLTTDFPEPRSRNQTDLEQKQTKETK
jgi:hypothetical protein